MEQGVLYAKYIRTADQGIKESITITETEGLFTVSHLYSPLFLWDTFYYCFI